MANASPAELKKEGEELKALFAKVKKKQHNCAILIAKEGVVIEAHIKKSPDILFKQAKKAGGMAKGAWGTMTMDGQVIILDPVNDKVPGSLTKITKKFFSERGLKFRLEIKEPEEGKKATDESETAEESVETTVSPNVEEVTEEQKTSPSDTTDDTEKTESTASDDPRKRLEDGLAAVQKQIDTLRADTDSVMHDELVDSVRTHTRVMEEENYDNAADTLRRIEIALEDYAGLLAKKQPLVDRMEAMSADIEKIKKGSDSVIADEVATAIRGFDYAISHNEWDGAPIFLDKIQLQIDGLSEGEPESNDESERASNTETQENVEQEDAEAATEDTAEFETSEEEENPERQILNDRLASVQSQVDALLADTENAMYSSLVDVMRIHQSLMEDGKYDRAIDTMSRIESVLVDYAGLVAKKSPLVDRLAALRSGLERVKKGENSEVADAVAAAERAFNFAIAHNEWDESSRFLDTMESHIDELGDQNTEQTEDETEQGNSETSGEEQETRARETATPSEEADPKALRSGLVKRFAAIKNDLGRILKAGSSGPGKEAREKAQGFAKSIASEDFASAQISMEDLERLVKDATSSPEKTARLSRISEMKKRLDSLLNELR
ncbi:MAG: hypothetical protein JKY31_11750 [Rhodobacteraceae bacterium]|nr:hypothetical protein [Paracoccaceae bacterium]